jgi:glycosyltransferase involved in cell wall biosynthesis
MPRVSIILPTFNRAYCLERAVFSIASQSYQDWELIVVDDGSTDGTDALRERFANALGERYIERVTRHVGVSAARNMGISIARGDYIAFQDSDDVWMPEKLGLQVAAMDKEPDVGFCFTDYAIFDDSLIYSEHKHRIPDALQRNIYPALLEIRHNYIVCPSVLLRRELMRLVGSFDEAMQVCEDIDLWARIARETNTLAIHSPLVAIHVRAPACFPYAASIEGRLRLYEKVVKCDPELDLGFRHWLYEELLTVFRDLALSRQDDRIASVLSEALAPRCKDIERHCRDGSLVSKLRALN